MKVLKQDGGDVLLFVKIVANSQENKIVEILEYNNKFYLKIKIAAMAVENKANKEIIAFLSKFLNLSKPALSIESGEVSSLKTIRLQNTTLENIQEKLHEFRK
ncbi:MAG: DUF167 domain-containing protein [Alphaproteobacteria bacterium]|nr:DUF167 domain-containing protein [Alphaproteobacteria bacterium]